MALPSISHSAHPLRTVLRMGNRRYAGTNFNRYTNQDITPRMSTRGSVETLIVGGGVAGLTVAGELARRGYTGVLLLEHYPKFGGRVATFRDPDIGQYEIGAGRIFRSHTRVHALIKKYGLHTFPISTESHYALHRYVHNHSPPNSFLELFSPLRTVLETLDPHTLATHTIKECLPPEYAPILEMFPYRAEVELMRADLALAGFKPSSVMGAAVAPDAYTGVVEGLDTITTRLAEDASAAGAVLKTRHRVTDVKRLADDMFEVTGTRGKKADEVPFVYRAKRVIIATCRCSLGKFSVLRGAPLLKQLATSPLMRIYAKYPLGADGRVWFDGLPKVVTAGALRYVIPINPKTGLIMISYTDGRDTAYWKDLEGAELESAINGEVNKLFPDITHIPAPTYLEKHYWSGGCTYWLPGTYAVSAAARDAMCPAPNVYVVGESISTQQAWIEGALESAEAVLARFFP
jgi:glycine/D-amino acid oxidase-like deaminating enzyme